MRLNHHAAQMDVRRSVADPTFDARDQHSRALLIYSKRRKNAGVKKSTFASSGGAVYGEQEGYSRRPEDHILPQPASPYGVSKRAGELYLSYYHQAFGTFLYRACVTPTFTGRASRTRARPGVVAIFLSPVAVRQDADHQWRR